MFSEIPAVTIPWPLALLAMAAAAALAWRALRSRRAARQLLERLQALERRHATELRAQRAAAEAAERTRTRFLAAASHDLRQPAHAIGLYLATLRDGELAPPQQAVAARMAEAVDALQALLAGLLDLSRIDADAAPPQWALLPLAPLLRRLADETAVAAEARGLRVALHLAPAAEDAATVTDPVLLERVLRNLLSNAVKHTRAGGVLLACRQRGEALRLEVWDSGVGIAAADQERVFQEFEQIRPGEGGLGLGLAIARRLAQQLQLKLALHSRPGRGTVFFVEGLVPAPAAVRQAALARQGLLQRLEGLRVVVLDDDAAARDAAAALLRRWGITASAAADAAGALAADATPADAVLADLHLADGRRGPDEAQALFAAWGRPAPLLLVSADAAVAQSGGLRKPLSPARLRAWLEQLARTTTDAAEPCGS